MSLASQLPAVEPLIDWVTAGPGWNTGIANPDLYSGDDFDAILSCLFSVNESAPFFTVNAPVKTTYSFRIQGTSIGTRDAYIRIYVGTIADGYLQIAVPATITAGDMTLSGSGDIVATPAAYVWDKAYIEVVDNEITDHFTITVNSISIDNAIAGVSELTLIKQPIITVDSNVSRWVCASNPIVYQFQRKDYQVSSYSNSGGLVRIDTGIAVDFTDQIAVGDYIYLKDVQYTGKQLVTAVSFSTNTLVTIDVPYVSGTTSSGYFNVVKRNYKVKIELFDNSDASLLFSSLQFSDTNTGLVTAFIDPTVIPFLSLDNDANYVSGFDVVEDTLIYKSVFIKYSEIIDGDEGIQTSATDIYTVYGARQIGDVNGGNLVNYVGFDTNPVAKFLTKFETISHWRGQKNSIEFIVNENSGDYVLIMKMYSINGTSIWMVTKDIPTDILFLRIDLSDFDFTNSVTGTIEISEGLSGAVLVAPSSWTDDGANAFDTLGATAFTINSSLASTYSAYQTLSVADEQLVDLRYNVTITGSFVGGGVSITPALFNGGSQIGTFVHTGTDQILFTESGSRDVFVSQTANGTANRLKFMVDSSNTGLQIVITIVPGQFTTYNSPISEIKNVKIKDPCGNPVNLSFRNSLGGDSFWCFDYNQDMNWNNVVKKSNRKVLFAQDITTDEWNALNDLNNTGFIYSENIIDIVDSNKTSKMAGQQVYIIDEDGNKTGVITLQTINNTKTRNDKHDFQIEIEYPEYFVQ